MKNIKLLSIEEATEFLGISRRNLENLMIARIFPYWYDYGKNGREIKFSQTALEEWQKTEQGKEVLDRLRKKK